MSRTIPVAAICLVAAAAGCKNEKPAVAPPVAAPQPSTQPAAAAPREVPATPAGLPAIEDSATNPTTPAKVALGHMLFFDKRLSKDDSMSCNGCHYPERAWTHPDAVNAKVGGGMNVRNAPTMQNLAYHKLYYWDGRMPTLEAVCTAAWKGQLGADPAEVAKKLNAVAGYQERFQKAFGSDATAENVPMAFAAFLRALKSGDSAFDRFQAGDTKAMSDAAQRGWKLFTSAGCITCHTPPLFMDLQFHNAGIGSDKPADKQDKGRLDATKDAADSGKFKTPSLRDVSKTPPYFHDGSAAKLEDAIATMAQGGIKNANIDPLFKAQSLSEQDKADLKAFLEALEGKATFTAGPAEMAK